MANISEQPINPKTLASLQNCARDGMKLLQLDATAEPKAIVAAVDDFVYKWQKNQRPAPEVLNAEDAPYIMGSLWGEQVVRQLGWEWAKIIFHDNKDTVAHGVFTPDRALAIYPIPFVLRAMRDPRVDATIALSFNMLVAGKIRNLKPGEYSNLMPTIGRIVPRI
jgi:hypothetical protein